METSFYTVEGLDGSGKSTLAKYMGEYLTELGIPNVVVDSYPRDENALFKRNLWIQQEVPPIAVLTLILELRMRVLKETIIPALLSGHVVVSDRWHDTTWVYQHFGMGITNRVMEAVYDSMFNLHRTIQEYNLSEETKNWLYKQIHHYRTVYLDVSLETSRARVSGRAVAKDAFEKANDDFFNRLSAGYRKLFSVRQFTTNPLFVIDANNDLEYVKQSTRCVLGYTTPCIPPKQ